MLDQQLIENWQTVKDKVDHSALRANKTAVTLLAVSKTKPVSMIATLLQAGQKDFGENYLQEAIDKMDALDKMIDGQSDVFNVPVWHYIGSIQRNKTRDIAERFDWVHTIERKVIAKRLNDQRPKDLPKLNVLIQVNIDDEDSKSGCLPTELDDLVAYIKTLENQRLRGIMIIPSKTGAGVNDSAFKRTQQLFASIANRHTELADWDTLSMGMSADMQEAIQHGSTLVRVGSAIFGERT